MKKALVTAFLGAILLAVVPATPSRAGIVDKLPMDGYAAVVNERIITIGDVMLSILEATERLRLRYSGEELTARREELFMAGLDKLVEQALILEEFTAQKGQMPERAVDDRINDIIFENFNNDKSELLSALAKDGLTMEEWRTQIRERLIVSAMRRNAIGDRVVISPRQIIEAYDASQERYHQPEQVKLRLIFIKQGADPEDAFKRISEARASIVGGTPMADVAKTTSEDATAALGGDWGWVAPKELRDDLRSALTNLPLDTVSEPIFTAEGYYLVQIDERRAESTKSLDEVRVEIENELKEKEAERLYKEWVGRLKKKYPVLYYIPRPPEQT